MKRVCVLLVCTACAVGFLAQSASAIPPFQKRFLAKYVEGSDNPAFVEAVKEAKCNVCHKGKKKTDHNAYGVELSKLLDKKEDKDNTDKIDEALAKVAEMKNGDGKTYAELIKDGKLPGGAE